VVSVLLAEQGKGMVATLKGINDQEASSSTVSDVVPQPQGPGVMVHMVPHKRGHKIV